MFSSTSLWALLTCKKFIVPENLRFDSKWVLYRNKDVTLSITGDKDFATPDDSPEKGLQVWEGVERRGSCSRLLLSSFLWPQARHISSLCFWKSGIMLAAHLTSKGYVKISQLELVRAWKSMEDGISLNIKHFCHAHPSLSSTSTSPLSLLPQFLFQSGVVPGDSLRSFLWFFFWFLLWKWLGSVYLKMICLK